MVAGSSNYVLLPGDEKKNGNEQNSFTEEYRRLGLSFIGSIPINRGRCVQVILFGLFWTLSCLLLVIVVAIIKIVSHNGIGGELRPRQGNCTNPPIRREWRTLLEGEKQEYIRAVQCLATVPSVLEKNGTVWDDFDWVHEKIGQNCKCQV